MTTKINNSNLETIKVDSMYAVCWNNEDTKKVVITTMCISEKFANSLCEQYNKQLNIYYVTKCNDIDTRILK